MAGSLTARGRQPAASHHSPANTGSQSSAERRVPRAPPIRSGLDWLQVGPPDGPNGTDCLRRVLDEQRAWQKSRFAGLPSSPTRVVSPIAVADAIGGRESVEAARPKFPQRPRVPLARRQSQPMRQAKRCGSVLDQTHPMLQKRVACRRFDRTCDFGIGRAIRKDNQRRHR
jgi:hypothetical protein